MMELDLASLLGNLAFPIVAFLLVYADLRVKVNAGFEKVAGKLDEVKDAILRK